MKIGVAWCQDMYEVISNHNEMFICDRLVTVAEHAESHRGWILPRTRTVDVVGRGCVCVCVCVCVRVRVRVRACVCGTLPVTELLVLQLVHLGSDNSWPGGWQGDRSRRARCLSSSRLHRESLLPRQNTKVNLALVRNSKVTSATSAWSGGWVVWRGHAQCLLFAVSH